MIRRVRQLVKTICASFSDSGPGSIRNWCDPKDRTCFFFNEDSNEPARCGYFEVAVLPLDPTLEQEYRRERELALNPDTVSKRSRCECGKVFYRRGNRQVSCPDCSERERRDRQREYQREHRQRQKEGLTVSI